MAGCASPARALALVLILAGVPGADALVTQDAQHGSGASNDADAALIVTDPEGDAEGRADLVRVEGLNVTDALTFRLHAASDAARGVIVYRVHYVLDDATFTAEARVNPRGKVTHATVNGEPASGEWSDGVLTIRLPWAPAGDPAHGTTLTGVHAVTVHAGGDRAADDTRTGVFTVHRDGGREDEPNDGEPPADANEPPRLDTGGNRTTRENATLAFTVTATDPDGDDVTLAADRLPRGATFDAAGGAFTWTPGYEDAGTHVVRFQASDGNASVSENVTITVQDENRSPRLTAPERVAFTEGASSTFRVTAVDPDGDAVTLAAEGLPEGAVFDPGTGDFAWTPGHDAAGESTVTFTADDGKNASRARVRILVHDVPGDVRVTGPVVPRADAAPGERVPFTFTVTNHGPVTDNVSVHAAPPSGWSVHVNASTLTLEPGTSARFTLTVTPDARSATGVVDVGVRSLTGAHANATVRVDLPVANAITLESARVTMTQDVHGTVTLAFKDGSPAAHRRVVVEERASMGFTRWLELVTDAEGRATFTLEPDPGGSHFPGAHTLQVRVPDAPVRGDPARAEYTVRATSCTCVHHP